MDGLRGGSCIQAAAVRPAGRPTQNHFVSVPAGHGLMDMAWISFSSMSIVVVVVV
jgi:hypothetical protein